MLSRFGVKELRCIWCIFSPSTTVCLPALLQTVFARRSSSPKPVNIYWPTYTKMPPWTSTLILRKKAIDLCSPVGKLKHMVPRVQRPGTLQKYQLHVHLQHCFPTPTHPIYLHSDFCHISQERPGNSRERLLRGSPRPILRVHMNEGTWKKWKEQMRMEGNRYAASERESWANSGSGCFVSADTDGCLANAS